MNNKNWLLIGVVVLVALGVWFYFDSREDVGLGPPIPQRCGGCTFESNQQEFFEICEDRGGVDLDNSYTYDLCSTETGLFASCNGGCGEIVTCNDGHTASTGGEGCARIDYYNR